jgi:hypothetical protein
MCGIQTGDFIGDGRAGFIPVYGYGAGGLYGNWITSVTQHTGTGTVVVVWVDPLTGATKTSYLVGQEGADFYQACNQIKNTTTVSSTT